MKSTLGVTGLATGRKLKGAYSLGKLNKEDVFYMGVGVSGGEEGVHNGEYGDM